MHVRGDLVELKGGILKKELTIKLGIWGIK